MTPEDRLRRAIEARTTRVEPAPDALQQIERKLMDAQQQDSRKRWIIGLGSAAALVVAVIVAFALSDDDDKVDSAGTTDSTTTTEATTTTTEATTTTTVTATVDPRVTIFPDPSTSRRFDDPVAAVTAFATDLVGYRNPIVGEFMQGDNRSGEVELRGLAQGAPTIVLVRQMEDDTWFVIGAATDSIRLDTPSAGATISSPQALEGAAYAFEGNVNVRLFADGVQEPIAETFVTGRGDGVLGDFDGSVEFTPPSGAEFGVLVLAEYSAEDGRAIYTTVIRVAF